MNKVIVSVWVLIVMAAVTFGQESKKNEIHGSVYVEARAKNKVWVPELQVYLTYGGKSKFGAFCWIQANKGYQQTYCGPTYDVRSWISISGAVGAETGSKNPFKVAGSVWAGNAKVQNLFLVEKGIGSKSSSLWVRDQFTVKLSSKTAVCAAYQTYQGVGGCIEQSVAKKVILRGEVLFNKAGPVVKVGIKFKF